MLQRPGLRALRVRIFEAKCFNHYWWTPWGATVDCGGGNLTISVAQAEAVADAVV